MKKVLVVEDDSLVADCIEETLSAYGFEVLSVFNPDNANSVIEKEQPDLVITDIFMPRKSGLDVIAELRRHRPDKKILAISGGGRYRAYDYLDYARQLGANGTLAKPFNASQLLRAVLAALDAPDTPSDSPPKRRAGLQRRAGLRIDSARRPNQ
ncbi:MAG: response regulator [Rhodospirillaceae bacterium]|nr:response regulator [Rhodospirillaceae bacterium]